MGLQTSMQSENQHFILRENQAPLLHKICKKIQRVFLSTHYKPPQHSGTETFEDVQEVLKSKDRYQRGTSAHPNLISEIWKKIVWADDFKCSC